MILDHLRPTATGLNGLPAWFLRLGAPAFATPIAQLFNQSLIISIHCSTAMEASHHHTYSQSLPPTPPCHHNFDQYPLLQFYLSLLQPPIDLNFHDQFAFRSTGSTTAALIALLQTISDMLISQPYVRLFALDFSKAFDTVQHSTLLEKLAKLNLPDEAYNWLKDFFDDHSHCTQFAGLISPLIGIIASVIQGSAIGPAAYVVNASDLRPINA